MFLEIILFLQKLKNFKNSVALFWWLNRKSSKSHAIAASSQVDFGDLFASERSNREGYIDFRGSTRDSLAGKPSHHEKHLETFFTILTLSVLAACPGDLLVTCFSHEKRVFCISKIVFKTFSVFPSTFCDCSLSSPFLSQLKLTQTLLELHFYIISLPNLQEKVWVLISSPHISCFELHFREYLCCCFVFSLWVCFPFFWDCPCLDCWGIVLMRTCFDWEIHVLSCVSFLKIICCPICDLCIIMCWFLLPILFEPNPCGSFWYPYFVETVCALCFSFMVNLVWSHWLLCD